jgi:hypothetical protein
MPKIQQATLIIPSTSVSDLDADVVLAYLLADGAPVTTRVNEGDWSIGQAIGEDTMVIVKYTE